MARSVSYGSGGGLGSGSTRGGEGLPPVVVPPPTITIFAPEGAEATKLLTSVMTDAGGQQWLRDGDPIVGQTEPTYLALEVDATRTISCAATGPGGAAVSNEIVIDPLAFPDIGYIPPELAAVIQFPAAPVLTSYHIASDLAELNTALAISGAEIDYFGPNTEVGTALVAANDILLRLNGGPGYDTVLEFAVDVHRIEIQGTNSPVKQINFRLPAYWDDVNNVQVFDAALKATDIRLTYVDPVNTEGSAALVYGNRILFDLCTLRGSDYGLFAGAAGDVFNEDLIVTSCYVAGGVEASMRILQTTRHIVTRSVLGEAGFSNKHSWRLHLGTSMAYCGECSLYASGIMLTDPFDPTDTLGRFWFSANRVSYTLTNGVIITIDPYTRITQGEISNNIFYMPSGVYVFSDIWNYGPVPGDWDLTGNVILPLP